jgi:hypothetical protein
MGEQKMFIPLKFLLSLETKSSVKIGNTRKQWRFLRQTRLKKWDDVRRIFGVAAQ